MRRKYVAGNWKMNGNAATARQLAAAVRDGVGAEDRVVVALFPPFPYLSMVAEVLAGSAIALGAQNAYCEPKGEFTGEVSPAMLLDVGCRCVILGHSERRLKLGEDDSFVNRKVHAALAAGLLVILCVGETAAERQANQTEQVLQAQLSGSLAGLDAAAVGRMVLAYEPVWAIGKEGQTATPQQAQDAHAFLRGQIAGRFGEEVARRLPICYGGSVKPDNAASLFCQPDVDGGLVGGCSLKAKDFLDIVRAALPQP
jgi:triosephosphate isomerase